MSIETGSKLTLHTRFICVFGITHPAQWKYRLYMAYPMLADYTPETPTSTPEAICPSGLQRHVLVSPEVLFPVSMYNNIGSTSFGNPENTDRLWISCMLRAA